MLREFLQYGFMQRAFVAGIVTALICPAIGVFLVRDLDAVLGVARARQFGIEALPMRFSDGMEVRRVTKVDGAEMLTLDLLLVNPNLEPVWTSRERIPTERGEFWVVSRQGLIQMKAWAGRAQDLADIVRLQELDR